MADDIKTIARRFVALLMKDGALRTATTDALLSGDAIALARIASEALRLQPPLDRAQGALLEAELHETYRLIEERAILACRIHKHHLHEYYSSAPED